MDATAINEMDKVCNLGIKYGCVLEPVLYRQDVVKLQLELLTTQLALERTNVSANIKE